MVVALAAAVALFLLPPFHQDPGYHLFADQRSLLRIPNFWNVTSNVAFLAVAIWGVRALRNHQAFLENWERTAYGVLLAGTALVAFGSSYYHFSPDNATLFWDRLPMAIVFMSLLASTLGERVNPRAGRLLLFPLVALGIASVVWWKISGDLRLYVIVQFYPMLAIPLMLVLFPPRYSGTAGIWGMIVLYGFAKILELYDRELVRVIPTGGHPWKHLVGALAMLCYVNTIAYRRVIVTARGECRAASRYRYRLRGIVAQDEAQGRSEQTRGAGEGDGRQEL